jgi:hypothetical protein
MTSSPTVASAPPRTSATSIIEDARRGHRALFTFAVLMAALAVVTAGLAVLDQRTLLGAPLWFKPLKFAISTAAYTFTLAWMLGQLPRPALRRSGWTIVIALGLEMVIIVGQAARGERSHFNIDGTLNTVLFNVMGVSIGVLYVCTLLIAIRFLREPRHDAAFALALRLGLVVTLIGMAVGFIMVALESHTVGVPDGGPGLPLVGWSTTGGDLRVGHFVGLHGLQALPLLAAGLATLARRWAPAARLDELTQSRIVVTAATGYALAVVLLTVQALRAQPLLAPDPVTALSWAAVVGLTGLALVAVVRRPAVLSPASPTSPGAGS